MIEKDFQSAAEAFSGMWWKKQVLVRGGGWGRRRREKNRSMEGRFQAKEQVPRLGGGTITEGRAVPVGGAHERVFWGEEPGEPEAKMGKARLQGLEASRVMAEKRVGGRSRISGEQWGHSLKGASANRAGHCSWVGKLLTCIKNMKTNS